MDRFNTYTNVIIDNIEKGFGNHPDDKGGATNWGITEAVARENGYTGDMRKMPRSTAVEIYKKRYWDDKIMSHIRNHVAFHVYDASINHGYSRAVKLLQKAVGVAQDGIIGVGTLNAISSMSPDEIILKFNVARMRFYSGLHNFGTFGNGWENRLFLLAKKDWEVENEKYLD